MITEFILGKYLVNPLSACCVGKEIEDTSLNEGMPTIISALDILLGLSSMNFISLP
jgi:hypothetical protein